MPHYKTKPKAKPEPKAKPNPAPKPKAAPGPVCSNGCGPISGNVALCGQCAITAVDALAKANAKSRELRAQLKKAGAERDELNATIDVLQANLQTLESQEVGAAMDCAAHEYAAVEAFRGTVAAHLRQQADEAGDSLNARGILRLVALRIEDPNFGRVTLAVDIPAEAAPPEPAP
jgi:hypothetical protein